MGQQNCALCLSLCLPEVLRLASAGVAGLCLVAAPGGLPEVQQLFPRTAEEAEPQPPRGPGLAALAPVEKQRRGTARLPALETAQTDGALLGSAEVTDPVALLAEALLQAPVHQRGPPRAGAPLLQLPQLHLQAEAPALGLPQRLGSFVDDGLGLGCPVPCAAGRAPRAQSRCSLCSRIGSCACRRERQRPLLLAPLAQGPSRILRDLRPLLRRGARPLGCPVTQWIWLTLPHLEIVEHSRLAGAGGRMRLHHDVHRAGCEGQLR
mmetsp:Transcript_42494/g.134992  ORF Transcript_42494/g.134992 Transcript_42494/m.134992 type:complete len:265 (-) Transcript_42494:899-1693(-)